MKIVTKKSEQLVNPQFHLLRKLTWERLFKFSELHDTIQSTGHTKLNIKMVTSQG